MTRRVLASAIAVLVALVLQAPGRGVAARAVELPARFTNQEYWRLISDFSEPGGYFRSDNLLSNEVWFQHIVPDLQALHKPGGVYLGVGPEQNFTYIAALRPRLVFILDIRRGNLHAHLLYKALFELAADRAEFVSLLFSRPRPAGLGAASTAEEIFGALAGVVSSEERYAANFRRVTGHLVKTRGLPLPAEDLDGLDYVYRHFSVFGPSITYNSSGGRGGRNSTTYARLMTATDAAGESRSYLANEVLWTVVRDLHTRNLIVPLVGNFAGPKALRAVGRYVRERGGTVTAFYLSNVEQYLLGDGLWQAFCQNVATLPLTESSTFIYSASGGGGGGGLGSFYRPIQPDVRAYNCAATRGDRPLGG